MDCKHCNTLSLGLYRCVSPETLEKINSQKKFSSFKKGDYLFTAGESADGIYILQSGIVRTFKISEVGREQTFSLKEAGSWVGLRDSLVGLEYNHSAVCLEDTLACFWKKDLINETLKSEREFQMELLNLLALEWRDSENQIFSLGTKQIHSKLAELLLSLHSSSGNSPEIELKITREIIASIIGTTTESVIRALSDFKARDWIGIQKNKIIFKDYKQLSEIANNEVK
ncbi:MAG: Crp/Fnr family transcriptional regulator [Leptospiraceae bacterium]|nr:Crp/Fnr family transcriptional regulator [Leptospiraceae bacterium]MCK6381745.1 Crp/Fnr family transcriptional regulator [Leptospiraceae bacterium]